jgi:hypothetical protein
MLRAATFVFLLALALPAGASAAPRALAPPGNSEADQYYETLPASTGPRAPDATKKAHDALREGALSEATEHALRRRGPRGLALATAVARTAPASRSGAGSQAGAEAAAIGPPSEPGMGALFPVVLAGTAAATLAFALFRRRSPAR